MNQAEDWAWRVQRLFERVEEGQAEERDLETLADWLLEQCLTVAYTLNTPAAEEIGVLAAEQLWQQILQGKLRWIPNAGLSGLLLYIRRHVGFVLRQVHTERSHHTERHLPLDEALLIPDETDLVAMIGEQLDWQTVLDALHEEMQSLSAQQQLVVELRLLGLQPREIAAHTGIPRTQVNVVLSQAYARLRQKLERRAQQQPALAEALRTLFNSM